MKDGGRSLRQLLESIALWEDRLARFLGSIRKEDFAGDELRQAGVSKCVEAIGEASGEILRRYESFAAANLHLDLAEAYRARNRLLHGYDAIDWRILWDTATIYVPRLVADVRKLLSDRHDG